MLLLLLLKYFLKKIYFFLENPLTKSRKCGIIYIQKTKTPRDTGKPKRAGERENEHEVRSKT